MSTENVYDIRNFFNTIKIKTIMTHPVTTVQENANLSDVEKIFIEQGTSHVCIVDIHHKLVGIITQKYLYKIRSPQKILPGRTLVHDDNTIVDGDCFYDTKTLNGYILSELMDKNVTSLHEEETVATALSYMARLHVGCIPIVNERQKVCGMLKEHDIIKTLAELSS